MLDLGAPIVITMDGIPAPKERARKGARGQFYTPSKTRKRENDLGWLAKGAMRGRPIITGPVSVTILAVFPVPASWSRAKQAGALLGATHHTARPDADNVWKLATDAMNKIVFKDDAQACEVRVFKRYGEKPSLTIEVKEI